MAAQIAYGYDDEDRAAIKRIAEKDLPVLRTALQADVWLPWVAYDHGIIDEPPSMNESHD